jgi:hypothetical protein
MDSSIKISPHDDFAQHREKWSRMELDLGLRFRIDVSSELLSTIDTPKYYCPYI